jgi:hypothetical protein
MKVGALVADTIWRPGSDYGGRRPPLSVLLPTFRRGADGTFLKAATSVLAQTERDLELIIVDDASTDGTADQIDALMRGDGRVSCLRHRVNVGLPAISEYEALLRARAPYLAFAFDDFIFEPDALGRLLEAAERRHGAVVHGQVDCDNPLGGIVRLGAEDLALERLAYANSVGNASVVVPRSVIDDVGFYDPHIALVRACDWDLWRRILREHPMYREDVFVGRELGVSRPDSLGRTYPQYYEAVLEYVARSRNLALRPEHFADVDVWEIPPESSVCLAEHVLQMREAFRGKAWTAGLDGVSAAAAAGLVAPGRGVAVVAEVNASSSLCFDGLPERSRRHLLFVNPNGRELLLQHVLARSDAVILVRQVLDPRFELIARWCTSMQVPLYYLIDDNFIVLREEVPKLARYTEERIARALEHFAGVLCTSAALADYFRALAPRADVQTIGPVFDATKLAKMRKLAAAPGRALRVGFIGGEFRHRSLEADVLPALAALSTDLAVEVFSRGPLPDADRWPFETTAVPFIHSFDGFLTSWRPLGIDVLVHPRGDTVNIDYKTSSVLLSALYLGAVPIVGGDPAFHDLGEAHGVLRADGDRASWESALRRAGAPERRRELLSRLEAFCRSSFAPDRTVRALDRILAATPPIDLLTWARRVRKAGEDQEHALTLTRGESQAHAAEVDRLAREVQARAADVERLQHEARERAARVTQLEEMSGALEARVRQLEHDAHRTASLEAEIGTRAYALSLRLRKVLHVLRRLAFRA